DWERKRKVKIRERKWSVRITEEEPRSSELMSDVFQWKLGAMDHSTPLVEERHIESAQEERLIAGKEIDFHLVQLFFACLPSLAVYLVAQYARYEMRKMEAELEEKKKQEEAKSKQEEEERDKEEEQIATDPELSEVKVRLGKLEEAIKEIAAESKKQSTPNVTKTQKNASELGEDRSKSESSSSVVQDKVTKQKSVEQVPYADPGKARSLSPDSDASRKDEKGENRIGGTSQDAKR
ncbi:hypothetical protein V6N11_061832, partial [Hibiscus sabdariffa]